MDFEKELFDLKRRVDDLEGAVNVLAGRIGSVHPEIVSLRTATAQRFDGVDAGMGRLIKKLDDVNTQVWSLRDDFPVLLGDALESALKRSID
ncbi:MAG: hypothetical protein KJ587_05905 [Alphaproteobacteria bacterium]|nr:hypothetical protein [Alphaproteobacteria bacterium]